MHPGLLRCRPSALRLGALITVDSYSTMCSHTISALCLRIPSGLHSFTALCRVGLQPRARLDGARCCVYIAARANADQKAHFWVVGGDCMFIQPGQDRQPPTPIFSQGLPVASRSIIRLPTGSQGVIAEVWLSIPLPPANTSQQTRAPIRQRFDPLCVSSHPLYTKHLRSLTDRLQAAGYCARVTTMRPFSAAFMMSVIRS